MPAVSSSDQQSYTFRMVGARQREDRIRITAEWVLAQFERFYREFLAVPYQAKEAFELQNHGTSIWLSRHRLSLYSSYIERIGDYLKAVQPAISVEASFLNQLENRVWRMVENRYEGDVAYAFVHSIRRFVYRDEWKPVEYAFWKWTENAKDFPDELLRRYDVTDLVEEGHIDKILDIPGFSIDYEDRARDSAAILRRVNRLARRRDNDIGALEMINAGFYRNRG
ncbi:MAG: bifunctional isocitrate dehydrogenase kinase/phosphatase, partial [Gammaproteobacteria bacterium]